MRSQGLTNPNHRSCYFTCKDKGAAQEESWQIIKVVDQSTTGKSNSFSTLTCKTLAMQEDSVVTKVKVLKLEFISLELLDVSDIDNC